MMPLTSHDMDMVLNSNENLFRPRGISFLQIEKKDLLKFERIEIAEEEWFCYRKYYKWVENVDISFSVFPNNNVTDFK